MKEKKQFRVRSVAYGHMRSLRTFAERLEKEMNELVESGYDINIHDTRLGFVIVGQLSQASQLLDLPYVVPAGGSPMSGEVAEFAGRLLTASRDRTPEGFKRELPSLIQAQVQGLRFEQMRRLADRAEADSARHKAMHQDPHCMISAALDVMVSELRKIMKLSTQ